MRKVSLFVLILILCFVWIALLNNPTVKAEPKTIVVPDDYADIPTAVDAANDGDTVFVKKGTHDVKTGGFGENLLIDKSIHLIGEDSQDTVIMGQGKKYVWNVLNVVADNVTISGFTIRSEGNICCLVVDASGCRIMGNNFLGELALLIDSENNTVSGNTIIGDRMYVCGRNHLISGNNVTGSPGTGIMVQCQNVTARYNNIMNNGLNYNEIEDLYAGGHLYAGGIYSDNGPVYIYGNNISDNVNFGIAFVGSDVTIFDNNIMRNDIGIRLLLLNSTDIGTSNQIYCNNLMENSKNVAIEQIRISDFYVSGFDRTDEISWDNGKKGNCWSNYNGTDRDGDGIGDTPYIIDENNKDNYPLMEPINDTVIPEFPSWAILPLILIVTLFLIIVKRKSKF